MGEKTIEFLAHAGYSVKRRGATKTEVKQAIENSSWIAAKKGRFECEKEYSYNKEWNKKFYKHKKVRPVFIEEKGKLWQSPFIPFIIKQFERSKI